MTTEALTTRITNLLVAHSKDECDFEEIGHCIWCSTHRVRIGATLIVVEILQKLDADT